MRMMLLEMTVSALAPSSKVAQVKNRQYDCLNASVFAPSTQKANTEPTLEGGSETTTEQMSYFTS